MPESARLANILVLDQDAAFLKHTRFHLEQAGCRVLPASTVAQAIAIATAYHAELHLLIVDLDLPDVNQLLRGVSSGDSPVRCLFISTRTAAELKQQSEWPEMSGSFLQKPFGQQALDEAVRQLVNNS